MKPLAPPDNRSLARSSRQFALLIFYATPRLATPPSIWRANCFSIKRPGDSNFYQKPPSLLKFLHGKVSRCAANLYDIARDEYKWLQVSRARWKRAVVIFNWISLASACGSRRRSRNHIECVRARQKRKIEFFWTLESGNIKANVKAHICTNICCGGLRRRATLATDARTNTLWPPKSNALIKSQCWHNCSSFLSHSLCTAR